MSDFTVERDGTLTSELVADLRKLWTTERVAYDAIQNTCMNDEVEALRNAFARAIASRVHVYFRTVAELPE